MGCEQGKEDQRASIMVLTEWKGKSSEEAQPQSWCSCVSERDREEVPLAITVLVQMGMDTLSLQWGGWTCSDRGKGCQTRLIKAQCTCAGTTYRAEECNIHGHCS